MDLDRGGPGVIETENSRRKDTQSEKEAARVSGAARQPPIRSTRNPPLNGNVVADIHVRACNGVDVEERLVDQSRTRLLLYSGPAWSFGGKTFEGDQAFGFREHFGSGNITWKEPEHYAAWRLAEGQTGRVDSTANRSLTYMPKMMVNIPSITVRGSVRRGSASQRGCAGKMRTRSTHERWFAMFSRYRCCPTTTIPKRADHRL